MRSVTFCRKVSLRHSGVMRSRKMRFPFLAARGRSSPAGTPASSLRQEMSVAPRMNASAARSVAAASVGLNT